MILYRLVSKCKWYNFFMKNILLILFISFIPVYAIAAEDSSKGKDKQDDLIIEISRGVTRSINIAIADFSSNNKKLARTINDAVANNFRLSGHLNQIDKKAMPNQPFRSNQIIYSNWRKSKTEYLILGEIKGIKGNKYEMNISIADMLGERVSGNMVFTFNPRYSRDFAHYISDYIYKTITGLNGSFSTKIAYVRVAQVRKKNSYSLHVADADGRREKTILVSDEPLASPAWSPDGKKLAYVSFENGRSNIFVQDIRKGTRWLVTAYVGINSAPAWSPDGKKLAVVLSQASNADIYLVDLAQLKADRITRNPAIDTEPSWSEDGSKLIFTSDRSGRPQIYEYNFVTRTAKRVIKNNIYSARPRYTHGDSEVVMINLVKGKYNVVMQNIDSGKLTQISNTRLDDSPSVSPDGNRVIYATRTGRNYRLAIASVDLGNSVYLDIGRGDIKSPAWSPFLFNFSF